MTQARSTTKIRDLAKEAIGIFTAGGQISYDDAIPRLIEMMVGIIEIATRMDARTGTNDPTTKKRTRTRWMPGQVKPAASTGAEP